MTCRTSFSGGDTKFAAAGDEDLFGGAAEHAVESELPLSRAAEFEKQLAAIIGHHIDRIDESHARRSSRCAASVTFFSRTSGLP